MRSKRHDKMIIGDVYEIRDKVSCKKHIGVYLNSSEEILCFNSTFLVSYFLIKGKIQSFYTINITLNKIGFS